MSVEFERVNRAQWTAVLLQAFGADPPCSAQWTVPDAIIRILTRFMGENLNHTMMPVSGGMDLIAITQSPEQGCLEFSPNNRSADTFRPGVLFFEHFPESPWNSFFLLETRPLQPSGVYDYSNGESEEVVELSPGKYIDISHHETGVLGCDEVGEEIPLPPTARVVCRRMQGKFLLVAKTSHWNLQPANYDGRHNRMAARDIRAVIQTALDRR